jgi:hypothetical protein
MNKQLKPVTEEKTNEDGDTVQTFQGDVSIMSNLTRAEIDVQIATAHQWPRSITKVMDKIKTVATLNERAADSMIYALPRANKEIVGASIRFAEAVMQAWGNCRVAARPVTINRQERFVEAEGVFHDLETNAATLARVWIRISDKEGRLFNDDMVLVTSGAAAARAKRNAILNGVPRPIWEDAYLAARQVLYGDAKTLVARRDEAFKALAGFGISPDQIFALLKIGGTADIDLDRLLVLRGMWTGLKNKDVTTEELLGPLAGTVKPSAVKPSRKKPDAATPKEGVRSPAEEKEAPSSPAGEGKDEPPRSSEAAGPSGTASGPAATQTITPEQQGRIDRDAGKSIHSSPDAWRGKPEFADELDRWGLGWRDRDNELATAAKTKGGAK